MTHRFPRSFRPHPRLRLVPPTDAPAVPVLDEAELLRLRAALPPVLDRLAASLGTTVRPLRRDAAPFAGPEGEVLLLACLGRVVRAGVPVPAAVSARALALLADDEAPLAAVALAAVAMDLPDAVGSDLVVGVDWLRALGRSGGQA